MSTDTELQLVDYEAERQDEIRFRDAKKGLRAGEVQLWGEYRVMVTASGRKYLVAPNDDKDYFLTPYSAHQMRYYWTGEYTVVQEAGETVAAAE